MTKGIIKLGTDSRGNFQRDIGWEVKASGNVGQHRFYFGANQTEAQIRCLAVLRCWEAIEAAWSKCSPSEGPFNLSVAFAAWDCKGDRPLWDAFTVKVAVAVAAGQQEFPVEPDDIPPELTGFLATVDEDARAMTLLTWLREVQTAFPMIRFRQVGDWPNEAIERQRVQRRTEGQELLQSVKETEVVGTGQTLHQALVAFSQWHGQKYQTVEGGISQHGRVCQKQLEIIQQHAPDMDLQAFGLEEIETLLLYWQKRPATKSHARKGQPISRDTAKNIIKRIRHFVRWLHKSTAFDWRKPLDYEVEPVRIRLTQTERAAKVSTAQVKTYTVEQLVKLWKYASPRERLLIVLALNCGFGQAEVTSLQRAEVFVNQPHGHYPMSGSFIKRLRGKSDVYGEWELWDVTERALAWWESQRPDTEETALIVTKSGKTLAKMTEGNNRNNMIPNAWTKLTLRIRQDDPSFPKLSFNKLRKTAGNLVKRRADGEMVAVFHTREKTVAGDDQSERYTDRRFDKLFAILRTVREDLASVFDAVADPFPADGKKRNPSISLAVREKIVALRKEGKQYKVIAAECNVSIATVRLYLKSAGLTKKYKLKTQS